MLKPFNEEELFARIENLLVNTSNRFVISEISSSKEDVNKKTIIEEKTSSLRISSEDQQNFSLNINQI